MAKRSTKRPSARMKAKERLADQFAELQALEIALGRALTQWEAVERAEQSLREALEPLVERGFNRAKIADLLGVDSADVGRVLALPLPTDDAGAAPDSEEHLSGHEVDSSRSPDDVS